MNSLGDMTSQSACSNSYVAFAFPNILPPDHKSNGLRHESLNGTSSSIPVRKAAETHVNNSLGDSVRFAKLIAMEPRCASDFWGQSSLACFGKPGKEEVCSRA